MKIQKTSISDLYVIEPTIIDNRIINYNKEIFRKNDLNMNFVQDNESLSKQNVLRGLHIQIEKPQGKLVSVLEGKIYDVAVDLRKGSKTYLNWYGVNLSEANKKMFYIPEGFAHGFFVISKFAKVTFKVSNYWNPKDEIGIPWNDSTINIRWPLNGNTPIIAEKDQHYEEIKNSKYFSKI